MNATIEFNPLDIVDQLNEEDAAALIEAIDLAQADTEFSEKVIVKLIKSMLKEFSNTSERNEFRDLILGALDND